MVSHAETLSIGTIVYIVKRRQRTHAASDGASKALPHEVGTMSGRSKTKLNTHALYPSRSDLRGITFKNKVNSLHNIEQVRKRGNR
jgi:hypothetical protein